MPLGCHYAGMAGDNPLSGITRSAVNEAIAEYDALGGDAFLHKYGFDKARAYRIVIGDREYDSKAIMGVAHAYTAPGKVALRPSDFSGGENTVARRLRALGFEVPKATRSEDWRPDELVLALDLYFRAKDLPSKETDEECHKLSNILDDMGTLVGAVKAPTYRNKNGVWLKLMNFRRLDPEYQKQGKRGMKGGGKAEEGVWATYATDLPALRAEASRILAALHLSQYLPSATSQSDEDPYEAEEGGVQMRVHRRYERDAKLIKRKKAHALKHGLLICEACNFDFEARYGPLGAGFIEVHHKKPVHLIKPGEKTKMADLALLCSNCHRMTHRRMPALGVDEVKRALRE